MQRLNKEEGKMIDVKMFKLIDMLTIKTNNRVLTWEKTARSTEYQTELKRGRVTSDLWYIPEGEEWRADIAVYNDSGEKVEYIQASQKDTDYQTLYTLWNIINNSYLKVDETINGIMKELEDK
jgi:hypothetical protein